MYAIRSYYEAAGVKVEVGILEKESLELNRRFFTYHNKQRPYIILKWAQTLDGFVDIDRDQAEYGQPTWITNEWAVITSYSIHYTKLYDS